MNIHEIIVDQQALAKLYAEDGAFVTASRVMRELAATLEAHASECFKELEALTDGN